MKWWAGDPGEFCQSHFPKSLMTNSLPTLKGSITWQIASYFCHMTSKTIPANLGAPCSTLSLPPYTGCLEPDVLVRPHLQPPPLPGREAGTPRPGPPLRPADWQLPGPIRMPPGSGAGPHARVALSVQVEAPGRAKWQEPLKGREPRRARTRRGPARSPPGPDEVSLDRPGGDPVSPGGTW